MNIFKSYGECPNCGSMYEPLNGRIEDNTKLCYCCDCKIMWSIVLYGNDRRETPPNKFEIIDIQTFEDSFTPHDC